MSDPSPSPNAEVGPDHELATTGPPRWVKVFGIITLVVVLLLVVMLLAGGGPGGHGPGRHLPGGGGDAPPSTITEHAPPAGGYTP